jgi:hypothetical protein
VSENVPDEVAPGAKRCGSSYLKINISGVGAIDQDDCGVAGGDQGGANLNDEACGGIILGVKGECAC